MQPIKTQNHSSPSSSPRQTIGLDLGNTLITLAYSSKQFLLHNTLLIEHNNVYINKNPSLSENCLTDALSLLSKKWQDSSFQDVVKYYDVDYKKGENTNIFVQSSSAVLGGEYYLELLVALVIKGVMATNASLRYMALEKKQVKVVCTVFQGKLNPFRLALKECLQLAGAKESCFVNTSTCIASSYLYSHCKGKDETEVIGIVDFGAQGLTFSLHKLYYTSPSIIQTLSYSISDCGGLDLTNLLVDHVSKQLIRQKGMDINKSPFLMHKLKLLCDEAKHILSTNSKAFVRLDGLPDILVYGCEVSIQEFQACVRKDIERNVEMIRTSIKGRQEQVKKLILTGGSCKIPLFRRLLEEAVSEIGIGEAESHWVRQGLLDVKSSRVQLIDVCPFELRMEGEEKMVTVLVRKGEMVPLRKRQNIKFPSGQLNLTLKFFQNGSLVATCLIPERPRQNTFSLFVEIDHNKMLSIFATTSQGLIKMHSNFSTIPRAQYVRYGELLSKVDFHIDPQ